MIISIVAALLAGACFAAAGVLQQRVAQTRPEDESLSPGLLVDLAKQRLWLAGIGLAVLSYVFQSLALAFGPLALVQPLIVSELIFALPVSAKLHGLRLGVREWLGALGVAVGLAVAIAAANPQEGDPSAPLGGWLWTLAAVGGLVSAALLVGWRSSGPVRASSFALAGATIMGFQSALLSNTVNSFRDGGIAAPFTEWQTYLLVVASIGGLLLIQSAYQAGPLATSMPVIDGAEPAVAVTIGILLFNETVNSSAGAIAVTLVGVLAIIGGIVTLDTSPLIKRLHEQEQEQKEEGESGQVGLSAT